MQHFHKCVLVLGEKSDKHLPFIEPYLSIPLVVIDVGAMIEGEELSYSLHEGRLNIIFKDHILDNIASVWVRGIRNHKTLLASIPSLYQAYARSAVTRHMEAIYGHFKSARWVSDYYALRRADYKPFQLQTAAELGFQVPDTLLTSHSVRAKQFIANHSVTITKPISHVLPSSTEKSTISIFFTTKINRDETVDLSGLSLAPAIFQQAINTVADLRVTVVGDKIFTASITNKDLDKNSSIRDWRIGHYQGRLQIDPYRLSRDIQERCIALVRKLGLQFGAIDLVLDEKNGIWFLEINPNGQWAFVEKATGQPIGEALANLLQGK